MFIRMLENVGTPAEQLIAGEPYEVTMAMGISLIRHRLAVETTQPPELIAKLLSRLDEGAGREALFLPFVGEFGHLIMTHMRIVHFSRASRKIVCCKPGQEVLFPSADECVTDWTDPITDRHRVGTLRDKTLAWPELLARFPAAVPVAAGGMTFTQEVHCIRPDQRIPLRPRLRGLWTDVVIGTRKRDFAPEKNWPHWPAVARALHAAGYSLAVIGDRATSIDLPYQVYHSGDLDADASIELLQNCSLYLGTDSGSAHLAATVGAPMAVLRLVDSRHRDLRPRMEQVNPGRVVSLADDCWDKPQKVIDASLQLLRDTYTRRRWDAEIRTCDLASSAI